MLPFKRNSSKSLAKSDLSRHDGFGTKTMALFSKLSKAFLLPIALLPIAGVFLGIGAAISSNVAAGSGLDYFGKVLNKMGDVAFGNLPILFAISTALAFSRDSGVAAITAVVGFLVMNGIQAALLHNQFIGAPNVAAVYEEGKWVITTVTEGMGLTKNWQFFFLPSGVIDPHWATVDDLIAAGATRVDISGMQLDAAGKPFFQLLFARNIPNGLITANVGVSSLNTGVLAAIFVGGISAWTYNRFHKTQLPAAVSFFSGTKLVPIVTFFMVIPLSFAFILIWPWVGIGLAKFGQLSGKLPGGLDSFIYEVIERSLVPFGLHHVFYAPLWWTNAGGSIASIFTDAARVWNNNPDATFGNSLIGGKWNLQEWVNQYKAMFPAIAGQIRGITPIDEFNSIMTIISNRADLWAAMGDQTTMYKMIANSDIINFTLIEHLGLNLGRFQSGKFGFMLLGLPLASVAMLLNVPKMRRKAVMGIYLSAAFTCFLTGITEPIEYTFLFVSPWLFYGVHMPLAAISFLCAGLLQTHVSMTVSGGIIDYIVFGIVPFFGSNSMSWLSVFGVLFVSAAMGGIYFFAFYFAVRLGKIKIPGREESEGATKLYTKADVRQQNQKVSATYTTSTDSNEIARYHKAAQIIDYLGGESNITNVDACASRLRIEVQNVELVDKKGIVALGGASGILVRGRNVQVIYGGEQEAIKPRMLEILEQQRAQEQQPATITLDQTQPTTS